MFKRSIAVNEILLVLYAVKQRKLKKDAIIAAENIFVISS